MSNLTFPQQQAMIAVQAGKPFFVGIRARNGRKQVLYRLAGLGLVNKSQSTGTWSLTEDGHYCMQMGFKVRSGAA
jgi:hypothetical protein